jgi:hypothetical protein
MAGVVNELEKAEDIRQVRGEETNASEPLITCRKTLDVIKTSCAGINWDEHGGSLPTAHAVTGIKAA